VYASLSDQCPMPRGGHSPPATSLNGAIAVASLNTDAVLIALELVLQAEAQVLCSALALS